MFSSLMRTVTLVRSVGTRRQGLGSICQPAQRTLKAVRHTPKTVRHTPKTVRHTPKAVRHTPKTVRHTPKTVRHTRAKSSKPEAVH